MLLLPGRTGSSRGSDIMCVVHETPVGFLHLLDVSTPTSVHVHVGHREGRTHILLSGTASDEMIAGVT